MSYLNLAAKERDATALPIHFGRLFGEGAFVVATSNFKLPKDKSRGGSNPLTYIQAYELLVHPIRFAEAEARRRL